MRRLLRTSTKVQSDAPIDLGSSRICFPYRCCRSRQPGPRARSRAALPVTGYAGIFALVNATYLLLCWEAADRPAIEEIPGQARVTIRTRSPITPLDCVAATAVSLHRPMFALAMICICLAVHLNLRSDSGPAPHPALEDTTTPRAARHPSSGTGRCLSSPESRPLKRPNHPA